MTAIILKAVLPALLVIGAMSPCLAQQRDGRLPMIDLQKLCRQNDVVVREVFTDIAQDSLQICVSNEQAAREQILMEWSTFPALAKSFCVQPGEYLPSYVEWQACLEITRDVFQQRKQEAAARGANAQPADTPCPVVKYAEDGSIKFVDACELNTSRSTDPPASHHPRTGKAANAETRINRAPQTGERK